MSDWQEQDDALVREFALSSFPAAIEFVDRLAELARARTTTRTSTSATGA